jgi:hypothetical protein
MRAGLPFFCLAPATLACVALAACGSRTGLLLPEAPPDSGTPDAPFDAEPDALEDVFEEPDAADDEAAPEEDALPLIDVTPPRPDAPNPCPDSGATLVYVITQNNSLMSFDPATGIFTRIGTIACPSAGMPFSMAVDQRGIAYVVFNDGHLFRVSTATASCRPTGFIVGQGGFPATFGMGFSRDPNGVTETLYVAGDNDTNYAQPAILGSINVANFRLSTIGTFRPNIYGPELTGTGAGDLFAFFSPIAGNLNITAIGQIDKTTGAVVAETPLPGLTLTGGWAFGFWGGDFYIFTGTPSTVTRFRPSDRSLTRVAMAAETIVGAGVSTCAPQQ